MTGLLRLFGALPDLAGFVGRPVSQVAGSDQYIADTSDATLRLHFFGDHGPDGTGYFTLTDTGGTVLMQSNYALPGSPADYFADLTTLWAALTANVLTLDFSASTTPVTAATLQSDMEIIGSSYADQLSMNHDLTTISAGNGADTVFVNGYFNGVLHGGEGIDTLDLVGVGGIGSYFSGTNLFVGRLDPSYIAADGFEIIRGTSGGDVFQGDGTGFRFEGGDGVDVFSSFAPGDIADYSHDHERGSYQGIALNLSGDDFVAASDLPSFIGSDARALVDSILAPNNNLIRASAIDGFGDSDFYYATLVIVGSVDADFLFGASSGDTFNAEAGNDHIAGNGGNDTIDGGGGSDIVYLRHARSSYTITKSGSAYTITDGSATDNDGTDSYTGVEFFSFNGTVTAAASLNLAPVITSNGGGASAALSVNENTTAVTSVTATDDGPTKIWSLSGDDAARFNISNAGVVTFKSAPNREAPTDLNHDNVYKVTVRVSDGSLSDTQALSITVVNVNEAPVITSNGGVNLSLAVDENAATVATVIATDVDGPSKTFLLTGADAALFKISSAGVVTFKAAPDFETPKDVGKNNAYNVTVKVSDGSLFDTQNLAITVKNLDGNSVVGTTNPDTIDLTHKIGVKGATLEADKIDGKAGNDTIRGSGGDDTLIGGLGKDTLYGDAGKDKFLFNAALGTGNIDTIGDFTHDTDLIQLDDAIFKTLGAAGALTSVKFWAAAGATKAHDANDRIVYDTATGKLYVDDDGIGGHAALHFATLTGKPPIDAGDFGVV